MPSVDDYERLHRTQLFLEMERFSNAFKYTHVDVLRNYRWSADSFHHWSRRWEYAFAFSYIQEEIMLRNKYECENHNIHILDAGSGCTFFPYYIRHKYPNCKVLACDCDRSLVRMFSSINKKRNLDVSFRHAYLESLSYDDNSVDIIYCISVLEHTSNHESILAEFKRVLRSDGLLIITFDNTLDGKGPIGITQTRQLLNSLNDRFKSTNANDLRQTLENTENRRILTTKFARAFDKKSLPWEETWRAHTQHFVGQLLRGKIPSRQFKNLTVLCTVWRNRKS